MPRRSASRPSASASAESLRPSRRAALVARATVAAMGQSRRKKRAQQQQQVDAIAIAAEAAAMSAAAAASAAAARNMARETPRGKKRALDEAQSDAVKPEPEPEAEPEPEPEPEAEPESALDEETQLFLQSLAGDERLLDEPLGSRRAVSASASRSRKRASVERRLSFEIPFSSSEIETIEARHVAFRPLQYGHICKCVYVSLRVPSVPIPVHKCTCFQEKRAASTTKRATEMASAKERLLLQAAAGKESTARSRSNARRLTTAKLKKKLAPPEMLCGDNCYNRMMFISCSDETCSAPDPALCSNRAIKRRQVKAVRVEFIRGPGFGLFADEEITAGDFIIEYVGEVIDDAECERRLMTSRAHGETHFYMLELEKDVVIDARHRSNESRFINHSCDPNSVIQKWNVDGIQRVGIFARRTVLPSEEITIDYNFSHFGEAVDCKCGSTACTGKIGRKRSEVPSFLSTRALSTRKRNEALELPPPEIKRPVHVSSLALLKSAQLDRAWLGEFGFNTRRLFLSHSEPTESKTTGAKPKVEEKSASSSSSPASDEWSTASVEDDTSASTVSIGSTSATSEKPKAKTTANWYERVVRGEHLADMRGLHSYICGGKADWTKELSAKRGGRSPSKATQLKRRLSLDKSEQLKAKNLIRRRLSLLDARSRRVADLVAFAEGKSKWNQCVASATDEMDPDRVLRLIKHVNDSQLFSSPDQNDLNEDACYRCGLSGELICCDGCPAAFHLTCTNLAMLPPANVPWFCSECTKPKILTEASASAAKRPTSAPAGPGRQLRTHATPLIPSLKKIFHSRASTGELTKRRHKKRARTTDRSYRQLEHGPLPKWDDSDAASDV